MAWVEMQTIVMDKSDYNYWKNNSNVYLQFEPYGRKNYELYTFTELNEEYKLIQEHYNSEDEYLDALYECKEFLYYEGYYLFEDDFEGEDDDLPVWNATAVGDKVVVSRAYLWS